jgi:hypothetical protein
MTEQVIDAEVVLEEIVEDGADENPATEVRAVTPTPGAEVAVRPPGHEVLMPMDTQQVVDGMKAYQKLLQDLLEPSDWQGTGEDKFLKKSGWRKIARAFNLSVTKIVDRVERDAEGNPLRAEATYRALAPNGQVQDGDGYCSADEKRFANAGGRQKLENDLRATATTRAKNRAISDLVGMGEVSAEEVEPGGGPPMPLASEAQCETLNAALNWLLPPDVAKATWEAIASQCGGPMFGPVANAVIATIKARKDIEGIEAEAPVDRDGPTDA